MLGPSPLWGEGRVRGDARSVAIGLVKNLSDVQNLDGRSRGFEALHDLDDAPGIGCHHRFSSRLTYMRHLALLELAGHVGLSQVVGPRRAAAPVGFFERHQLEPRDLAEKRARLLRK